MNIFVDESGSFVSAPAVGAWNVVSAVTAPESARTSLELAINALKLETLTHRSSEIKLHALSEQQFIRFVDRLAEAQILLFATATDAGLNNPAIVAAHQADQVAKVRENIPRMKYEGGRHGVELLASQLERLSPQLYAQLTCQVHVFHDVVRRAINYYAQRVPASLREFRWRVDQKNTSRTDFEDAFEKIVPIMLQSRSIREPGVRVEGFDYRHLRAYEFTDGKLPDYLQDEIGLQGEAGLNVQKLIRGNLRFQDSKANPGIQVADLLASGLRRCLRGGFKDNRAASSALGSLMLQNERGEYPIHLVSFARGKVDSEATVAVVREFALRSRRLLVQGSK